jgi:hypothetical protein
MDPYLTAFSPAQEDDKQFLTIQDKLLHDKRLMEQVAITANNTESVSGRTFVGVASKFPGNRLIPVLPRLYPM